MASEPVGIQRTRAKVHIVDGVRHDLQWQSRQINGLPAKVVTRGTAWGNLYKIGSLYNDPFKGEAFAVTQENCLELYEYYVKGMLAAFPDWLEPLRGHNLACFCPVFDPYGGYVQCHRDVLLSLVRGVFLQEVIDESIRTYTRLEIPKRRVPEVYA